MWRIFWAKYFHNISNFKFLEEGINSSISNASQKELIRGKGGGGGGRGNPVKRIWNFTGQIVLIFLLSGANLTRSDFNHSTLFQS